MSRAEGAGAAACPLFNRQRGLPCPAHRPSERRTIPRIGLPLPAGSATVSTHANGLSTRMSGKTLLQLPLSRAGPLSRLCLCPRPPLTRKLDFAASSATMVGR